MSQVSNLAWSKKHSSELVSTHGFTENCIFIWGYPSMNQVARLEGHSCRIRYMAMSPDGEDIVIGASGNDQPVQLYIKSSAKVNHKRKRAPF